MIKQAVILVGGRGTRLGDIVRETPKPMLQVGERPFIEYVIAHLTCFGIEEILLLAGYRGEVFVDAYHGKRILGANIRVLVEPEARGTGGALTFAAETLESLFLLVNGDTFFEANLAPLIGQAVRLNWTAGMLLRHIGDVQRYGSVKLAEDGRVVAFRDKASTGFDVRQLVNAGAYVLKRDSILGLIKQLPCSIENEVFPQLASSGQLFGVASSGYFVDIGIPESLACASAEINDKRRRPAVFLDRDGVLNEDAGYTHRPDQLKWIASAKETVRILNDAGHYVFVITNQAGIARGYYNEDAVREFHRRMQNELLNEGAHVDAFYFCPHHPAGTVKRFAIECECRKPLPGLLDHANRDWPIDVQKSFMIGDKDSDLQAALAFGIHGVLFSSASDRLIDVVRRAIRDPGTSEESKG